MVKRRDILLKFRRTTLIVFCGCVIACICFLYPVRRGAMDFLQIQPEQSSLLLCDHFKYTNGDRTAAADTIFMLLTSPTKEALSWRHVCALESAATHHPETRVLLLHSQTLSNQVPRNKFILDLFPNLWFVKIDPDQEFKGTPLEAWSKTKDLKESQHQIVRLSDALRMLVIWKCGGTYIDTDCIVLKKFPGYKSFMPVGSGNEVSAVMIRFAPRAPIPTMYLSAVGVGYDKDNYVTAGLKVEKTLVERMNQVCPNLKAKSYKDYITRNLSCHIDDLTVLPWQQVYPLYYTQADHFITGKNYDQLFSQAYIAHYYNKLLANKFAKIGSGVILDEAARRNCPKTYQLMKNQKVTLF